MNFRDGEKAELSKMAILSVKTGPYGRLAPEQGVHIYCIVNKVVGSQPNIQSAQGLKGWEKANKDGYDLWKTVQRWPNCDLFRTPLSAWR